jgi:hypothetical protein
MAAEIQSIPEMYTDKIEDLGAGAREVHWWMRVIFVGGDPAGEWHFYGTDPATVDPVKYADAVRPPATHFPANFENMTDPAGLFYDLARDVESNNLTA